MRKKIFFRCVKHSAHRYSICDVRRHVRPRRWSMREGSATLARSCRTPETAHLVEHSFTRKSSNFPIILGSFFPGDWSAAWYTGWKRNSPSLSFLLLRNPQDPVIIHEHRTSVAVNELKFSSSALHLYSWCGFNVKYPSRVAFSRQ